MVFANPVLLFGLFALAIPILIHLFNFRRYRKIYFTNVRFLAAIRQETRKRSELKQLLILLSRLLAVASLVLAFAQPYIPSPLQQKKLSGQQAVSIYIDNSFSMEATNSYGTLLETAKSKALEIAGACQPSDQFLLITNDAGSRFNQTVSREEFMDLVKEVGLSPVSVPMSTIILRQKEALDRTKTLNRALYLISDFQRATTDLALLPPDSVNSYLLFPLIPGKRNNLSLDTAWFESPVQQPAQQSVLKVRVRNAGDEAVEKVPVKLTVNGQPKAVASIALEPGSETGISLSFTNEAGGYQTGTVEIMDYPVVFDDKLFISYELVSSLPILAIHGGAESPYLNALFGDDSTFMIDNEAVKRLDYSSLSRYRVILLDGLVDISTGLSQELTRYARNGGELIIFPAPAINPESYRSFFAGLGLPAFAETDTAARRVDGLNTESTLFFDVFEKNASGKVILPENVDLPIVFLHYRLSGTAKGAGEVLMRLENGDPFLSAWFLGKGRIYLFTAPLDPRMTNFPRHPLFVPVLVRMALLSKTRQQLFWYTGQNEPLEITGDTLSNRAVYKLKKEGGSFEIIPEVRNTGPSLLLFPHEQVREAGIYSVERNGLKVNLFAFNFNRAESDPSLLTGEEITSILNKDRIRYFTLLKDNKTPVSKQVKELQQGKPLWKLFLLVTLLFIATEIAIIRIIR
jgi:hypothetical protein